MSMPDLILTEFVPLAALTSWRIGGVARYLATVRSPHGVAEAIAFADSRMLPVWILGGGSNMLISDDGLPGVVIRMRDMHIDITPDFDCAAVHIGAGAPMAGTVRQLVNAGWAGMAWAEGLPGTVGGAVYGNAGCYGGAMADTVQSVDLWRAGTIQTVPPSVQALLGCQSNVPFLSVDFTGNPVGSATVTGQSRNGYCCSASGSDKCMVVEFTLDPE